MPSQNNPLGYAVVFRDHPLLLDLAGWSMGRYILQADGLRVWFVKEYARQRAGDELRAEPW